MNSEILCPKCNWKPDGGFHWQCTCFCVWNTFDTNARCPSCSKIWRDTQCPPGDSGGCGAWSDHLNWYQDLDDKFKEMLENKIKKQT